jgi:penicillin-binding protein 1A
VKAFDDGVTAEATKILQMNVQEDTGTHANFGCPAAGKTGTTDHNTDAWFVGFTPRYSTAVWVGYPNSRVEMNGLYFGRNVDGGTFPADIWNAYMKAASGKFCGSFPKPKTPFSAQPFQGHYAGEAGKGSKDDHNSQGDSTTPGTTTGTGGTTDTTTTDTGTDNGGDTGKKKSDTGGNGFDPNQYETPPQGPPTTESPGGGAQAPPGNGQ